MSNDVVPSLIDRGMKLGVLSDSVGILVEDTDRFNTEAGRIEERKDRLKLCLGMCCLTGFCLAIFWYMLSGGSAPDE